MTIDGSEKVIVQNLDFLNKLPILLQKTKPRVLANYMMWRAAKVVLSYLNKAAQNVEQEYEKVGLELQLGLGLCPRCGN